MSLRTLTTSAGSPARSAAAAVTHPNICTVYDVGDHEGRPYLVMELLEGAPLEHFCQRGPMPLERALEIAGCVAGALDVAHRRGIIHRDIKLGEHLRHGRWPGESPRLRPGELGETSAGRLVEWQHRLPDRLARRHGHGGLHVAGAGARRAGRRARTDLFSLGVCCTNSWPARSRFGDRRQSS